MRRTPSLFLPILLAAFLLAASAASGQYVVVGSASSEVGPFTRTETTIQDGPAPIDQFKIVRLARTHLAPEHARAVVFLLPSLGIDFSSYEETDPRRHPAASIAGYFAQRGLVVYGYSSRAEGVPAGGCEAGVIDCSPMADWGLQTLAEDIAFVRAQIAQDDPGLPVFVGGLSLGAIGTIAVLDDAPDDYAGAFLWEGMLFSNDPAVVALNQGYCAGLQAQIGAGIVYDGFGNNLFKKINKLAELQPDGLTAIPLFPSFLTNHQVLVSTLSQPAPGPVSGPVPGYILANGDPATDQLFYANEERLFENVSRFNDYAPLAAIRDLSCSLAGVETSFTDGLAQFDGPILAIGGGRAFGPYMQDTIDLTGSTDVTFLLEPDFGHVDHLLSANHRAYVERPIYRWIVDRLP